MKTKEKIIEEFQKATPIWHKELPKELHNKSCPVCGIIPDNLLKLSKALSQQKQEIVEEIEPVIEEMEEVINTQEKGLGYDAKRLKKWIIEWKNQLKQKLTK